MLVNILNIQWSLPVSPPHSLLFVQSAKMINHPCLNYIRALIPPLTHTLVLVTHTFWTKRKCKSRVIRRWKWSFFWHIYTVNTMKNYLSAHAGSRSSQFGTKSICFYWIENRLHSNKQDCRKIFIPWENSSDMFVEI